MPIAIDRHMSIEDAVVFCCERIGRPYNNQTKQLVRGILLPIKLRTCDPSPAPLPPDTQQVEQLTANWYTKLDDISTLAAVGVPPPS